MSCTFSSMSDMTGIRIFRMVAFAMSILAGCAARPDSAQMLYEIEVRRDGEVISCPKILVNAGQAAQIMLEDESGPFVIDIAEDGDVRASLPIDRPDGSRDPVQILIGANDSGAITLTGEGWSRTIEVRSTATGVSSTP